MKRHKMRGDKSQIFAPQTLRESMSSSRFLLPSETASMGIQARFGTADLHPSQIKHTKGYLSHRSNVR
jgi:hypothetical protein